MLSPNAITVEGLATVICSCPIHCMDVKQMRLKRFREIWATRFASNIAAMARALESSPNQVRFYLNPEKPGGRWMGEEFARNVEGMLNLPRGHLDREPADNDTVDGLLQTIAPILDAAPDSLRRAVLALALKYEQDPAAGERIAAAIRVLAGTPDEP